MHYPGCQMTFLRQCALSCVIMLWVAVVLTYYRPTINLSSLDFYMRQDNQSCWCPVEAMSQCSNKNCSARRQKDQPHAGVPGGQVDSKLDTLMLIWMWPFGYKHELNCDMFNITGCQLSDDRSLYPKAHGVIFHHRDIGNTAMPTEPRPWFQKWIWFNMESPANSGMKRELNNLFNMTVSYRLDSTIQVPYGRLEPLPSEKEHVQLPSKDKLVCWVVSHWEGQLKRVKYYNELKKHININVYGAAFGKPLSNKDYNIVIPSCKFYLAFENSVSKDYFSDKLFLPLELSTVPVVLGPPRQNYERIVPPHSFIHINDFSSPKDLAQRLLYLDQHNDEYRRFLDWRKRFHVIRHKFGHEAVCKSCLYLQKNKSHQVFPNLNKWFWGSGNSRRGRNVA